MAFSNIYLGRGVKHGSACGSTAPALHGAQWRAAEPWGLARLQRALAQPLRPERRDLAVPAAADGVLGHGELGHEGARHAVILRAGRGYV